MQTRSFIPQSAIEAGLPARYRYWAGRSGRSYLFTLTDAATLEEVRGAVLLAVRFGEVIWAGESAEEALRQADGSRGAGLYIHLLSGSAAERRRIVADLAPEEPGITALAA